MLSTTWLTSAVDRVNHAVTDPEMDAGLARSRGIFRSVWPHGGRVLAAPEHAARRADLIDGIWPRDEDAAGVSDAFDEVAHARGMKVITMAQYSELIHALP